MLGSIGISGNGVGSHAVAVVVCPFVKEGIDNKTRPSAIDSKSLKGFIMHLHESST